ncbi:hypothetical protein HK414_13995 [Ramlibacter terrae]|uniref:Calcium-binding protein n=1 Tax=Ramlibacter terrae TaxID=2732511 RepID=A0ABX6P5Q5_9BURK|nr:hypothetical protein HK414_13995 [Ramlibacter terrae]
MWGARLFGNLGNDTLIGSEGNDELDGGAGADWMEGGEGYDVYHLRSADDVIVELAGGGIDGVISYGFLPARRADRERLHRGRLGGGTDRQRWRQHAEWRRGRRHAGGRRRQRQPVRRRGHRQPRRRGGQRPLLPGTDVDTIADSAGVDTVVTDLDWVLAAHRKTSRSPARRT